MVTIKLDEGEAEIAVEAVRKGREFLMLLPEEMYSSLHGDKQEALEAVDTIIYKFEKAIREP